MELMTKPGNERFRPDWVGYGPVNLVVLVVFTVPNPLLSFGAFCISWFITELLVPLYRDRFCHNPANGKS